MPSSTPPPGSDGRHIAVACGLLLGGLAIARPFAETGSVDDFSYAHMAKVLADTGRFAYNGWPTAMLGVQIWWAAAWIKLFGFSFTLTRLSVLPAAFGAVALTYVLARRCRLPPGDALFAAASLAFTGTFFSLAPTFMTDVPALFFLLASFQAFVLAVESADRTSSRPTRTILWLLAGMLLSILGGTIRQTVWFALPSGAACLALGRRTAWQARLAAAACGLVGLATIVIGSSWFNAQPYAIPMQLTRQATHVPASNLAAVEASAAAAADARDDEPQPSSRPAHGPAGVSLVSRLSGHVLRIATLLLDFGLAMIPVVCLCFPAWISRQTGSPLRAAVIVAVAIAASAATLHVARVATGMPALLTFPPTSWGGLGTWPAHYPFPVDSCLPPLRCTAVLLLAGSAIIDICRRGPLTRLLARPPAAILVPLAYMPPYLAAVAIAARTTGGIFSRYLLPILPLAMCATLAWTAMRADAARGQKHILLARRSPWAWAVLASLAAINIASVHDAFAANRARQAAISFLEDQGVPRHRIAAGIAIDGWEQIALAGFINDGRIRIPADAWKPLEPDGYPNYVHREQTPRIVPEHIVTTDAEFLIGDATPFPRFPFTCWLPSHHRAVFIHHQPPPTAQPR